MKVQATPITVKIAIPPYSFNYLTYASNYSQPANIIIFSYSQKTIHNVEVVATIELITGTQRNKQHALCDTEAVSSAIGSLNYIRFHEACTPIIVGDLETTDEYGNATFSNFSIIRGPIGKYDIIYHSSGIKSERASVYYESLISSIECINVPQPYASLAISLNPQPQIRVLGIDKMPIKGIKVYAISLSTPRLNDEYLFYYRLNGKRFALLQNVESEETDAEGIAHFKNLTIIGSTDEIVYIHFSVNGQIKEWSTKNYELPQPIYPYPIIIKENSTKVQFMSSFSKVVYEGDIIEPIKLKLTDESNTPIVGVGAVAILTEFCNEIFPNNFVMLLPNRKAKELLYPIAASYPNNFEDPIYNGNIHYYTTDFNGEIIFDKLRFSQYGNTINGSCLGKVEFYVGKAKSEDVTFEVKTTVSEIAFEKFYWTSRSNDKQFSIWKIYDKKGNGIQGKMVNLLEFIADDNNSTKSITLNITNVEDAVSDSAGILLIEFEPIIIKQTVKGRIKIQVDGLEGWSSSIKYVMPNDCLFKISYIVGAQSLDADYFNFDFQTITLCGDLIDTFIEKFVAVPMKGEFGYPSLKPVSLLNFGLITYIPNNGLITIDYQKRLQGTYMCRVMVLVSNQYFHGFIPMEFDFSITKANIGSIYALGNDDLNHEINADVNNPMHFYLKSTIPESLENITDIYIIPLDIPRCLINQYSLYWFFVKTMSIDDINYNYEDSFLDISYFYYIVLPYIILGITP